jgi:hypothetical protein
VARLNTVEDRESTQGVWFNLGRSPRYGGWALRYSAVNAPGQKVEPKMKVFAKQTFVPVNGSEDSSAACLGPIRFTVVHIVA